MARLMALTAGRRRGGGYVRPLGYEQIKKGRRFPFSMKEGGWGANTPEEKQRLRTISVVGYESTTLVKIMTSCESLSSLITAGSLRPSGGARSDYHRRGTSNKTIRFT